MNSDDQNLWQQFTIVLLEVWRSLTNWLAKTVVYHNSLPMHVAGGSKLSLAAVSCKNPQCREDCQLHFPEVLVIMVKMTVQAI